ncbi:hypothetical protein [Brassicibacter mesophilus]|uniref:hypothetical protein n=1 Tax=Brassicibacter mesophilus TaxID=745119 RepID=UPI003D220843
MSKALAPIHYWLFNKILLHEKLEEEIIQKFSEQFGNKVYDFEKDNIEKYGDRIPNVSLEGLIDTNNIHGWLQNKISTAETRQAGILADLFKEYKNNGILLAKLVYEQNGIKCGNDARTKYSVNSPKEIYDVLNNYILDGMPCDNVNNIIESDSNYLEYTQVRCLHIIYWNKVGIDPRIMYDLRSTWNGAFVNAANPEFKYQVDVENIGGIEGFKYKIYRK